MPNPRRHRSITLAVIPALVVAIVLMVSGIATADDSSTPADPTTATAPAASNGAPTTPTSTDPSAAPDASDAAPSTDAPTTTEPSLSVGQDTTVDNSQTGVANTGVNTAVGDTSPVGSSGSGGDPAASVTSGDAAATGGASQDAIVQQATAVATQAAHIVITQLALIVNIGLAAANSGADVATAGSGGGGVSLISTGDASVTGLGGSTAVTQVVHLLDSPEQTDQTAAVTNVGVGVGNTGANLAVGQLSGIAPDGSAVAVSWGPPDSSSISSGSATAVGDATHTTIVQVAMGTASDDGTLQITQRAVVVNFGAAIANTGFGMAGDPSADATALLVRGIVLALLTMLQPDAPTSTVASANGASGGGVAAISTGNAGALGDSSSTTIHQLATGSVTGDHAASASQTATVGNFGFAFANTGADAAGGALPVGVQAQLASIPAAFSGFLDLLAAPGAQAAWSDDLQLGAELLAASASVTAVQSLFDLPGADGTAAQVVVRQITGILNLMISVAVSGQNDVTTASDAKSTAHVTARSQATNDGSASAVVRTGDADVSNNQTTTICQVIDVSPSVCLPPTPVLPIPPVTPVLPAAVVAPVAAEAAGPSAAQLAFTGSSSLLPEGAAGAMVALAGLALVVVTRRRRRPAGPRERRGRERYRSRRADPPARRPQWGAVALRQPLGDLYQELGVACDATREEIAAAYRARAKELHPDTRPAHPDAAERFTRVGAAYAILSDPAERARYDASMLAPPPSATARSAPIPAPPVVAAPPPKRPRLSRKAARWCVVGGPALIVLGLLAGAFVVSLQHDDADLRAHGIATTAVVVPVNGERRLEFETRDGAVVRAAESVKSGEEQPALGTRVHIHYDRNDPTTIVTDESHTGRNVTLWIVTVKLIVGGAVLLGFGARRLRRS